MIDSYLFAWGAWLLGSAICLIVWARILNSLPELMFYIIWWATLGVVLAPAPESVGSNLWAPAMFAAVFDLLNGIDGGFMRAGQSLISGAIIGAILGVMMSILRTRKRLNNVGA
jgi:hypothetical protein